MAAGWVRISLPPEVVAGIDVMAEHCGWEARLVGSRTWEVRQRDQYGGSRIPLLSSRREVTAATAQDAPRYAFLSSDLAQDRYDPDGALWARARPQLEALLQGGRVDVWNAFTLAVVSAPDAEVANLVQGLFTRFVVELPEAALWCIRFHRWLMPRHEIATTLFGIKFSSERLSAVRDQGYMLGSRGLQAFTGFRYDQYLHPLLLAHAPWLSGLTSARTGGLVAVCFGNLEAGREPRHAELIDLYWPKLYSALVGNRPAPRFDPADLDTALPWWVERVSELLTVVLDPAQYQAAQGDHDVARHLSTLLSLDRLFAVVNTLLVASRREEFVRTTMMFEALDLIDGLTRNAGNYQHLLSFRYCAEVMARLEQRLPEGVKRLVMGRCRAAVEALFAVAGDFFVDDRHVDSDGVRLEVKGSPQVVSWDNALHRYLRLLRNGAHSFIGPLSDPYNVAMMSSHTGELAPELADIAFLHLVDLVSRPEQLSPGFFRRPHPHIRLSDEDIWKAVSR